MDDWVNELVTVFWLIDWQWSTVVLVLLITLLDLNYLPLKGHVLLCHKCFLLLCLQPAFRITGYSLIGDGTAQNFFSVNNIVSNGAVTGASINIISALISDPNRRTQYTVGFISWQSMMAGFPFVARLWTTSCFNWPVARTENVPSHQTNGCRVNILLRVDPPHYYVRVMIASSFFEYDHNAASCTDVWLTGPEKSKRKEIVS